MYQRKYLLLIDVKVGSVMRWQTEAKKKSVVLGIHKICNSTLTFTDYECVLKWRILKKRYVSSARRFNCNSTPSPHSLWRFGPTRAMTSSFLRFLDHTQRRITVGRTPLDELSARHRDLYLTTHNTHNRQASMPSVRFEPTISADERPLGPAL